jgi:hypothetical protein
MPKEFTKDPVTWIEDRDHAVQLLTAYLAPSMFTGALWDPAAERRNSGSDCFVIDAEDLYLPTLLSAPVRRSAGQAIIESSVVISEQLRDIPPRTTLWDPKVEKVDKALDAAEQLFSELKKIPYVGPTTASKLAAAKRPRLLPIWDSQVSRALGATRMSWRQYWRAWRETITPAVDELYLIASEVGHPDLSPLRTLDIIIWMDEWGWKDLPTNEWNDLKKACAARQSKR